MNAGDSSNWSITIAATFIGSPRIGPFVHDAQTTALARTRKHPFGSSDGARVRSHPDAWRKEGMK